MQSTSTLYSIYSNSHEFVCPCLLAIVLWKKVCSAFHPTPPQVKKFLGVKSSGVVLQVMDRHRNRANARVIWTSKHILTNFECKFELAVHHLESRPPKIPTSTNIHKGMIL